LGGVLGITFSAAFCPSILDRDSAAVDPAEFAQALHECSDPIAVERSRARAQVADRRQLRRLLRARREGPRSRAADERDDVAPFQLIELHSVPASKGRITGYRIAEDQSGCNETILRPVSRALKDYARLSLCTGTTTGGNRSNSAEKASCAHKLFRLWCLPSLCIVMGGDLPSGCQPPLLNSLR